MSVNLLKYLIELEGTRRGLKKKSYGEGRVWLGFSRLNLTFHMYGMMVISLPAVLLKNISKLLYICSFIPMYQIMIQKLIIFCFSCSYTEGVTWFKKDEWFKSAVRKALLFVTQSCSFYNRYHTPVSPPFSLVFWGSLRQ